MEASRPGSERRPSTTARSSGPSRVDSSRRTAAPASARALGVRPLMIRGRGGERHEDRREAPGQELRGGHGTGAADRQIGEGKGVGHPFDVADRGHPGGEPKASSSARIVQGGWDPSTRGAAWVSAAPAPHPPHPRQRRERLRSGRASPDCPRPPGPRAVMGRVRRSEPPRRARRGWRADRISGDRTHLPARLSGRRSAASGKRRGGPRGRRRRAPGSSAPAEFCSWSTRRRPMSDAMRPAGPPRTPRSPPRAAGGASGRRPSDRQRAPRAEAEPARSRGVRPAPPPAQPLDGTRRCSRPWPGRTRASIPRSAPTK
jgi:hypothetical protein